MKANSHDHQIYMFSSFGSTNESAMRYSTVERTWAVLPPMPRPRQFAASGTLSFGITSLLCACVADRQWTDSKVIVAAMRTVTALTHFPPGLLPLIVSFLCTDSVLLAGGSDTAGNILASAICYSLDSGTWCSDVPPMSIGRMVPASLVIGGRMMVFGGFQQDVGDLTTCEAFDPSSNEWTALPPMSIPRFGACAVAWEGRAFVIGGSNGSTILASLECFDPVLNQWSDIDIAPMMDTRYRAAAVAVPGRGLLVMGGRSYNGPLQSAELWDPATNAWRMMAWELPKLFGELRAHIHNGVLHIVGRICVPAYTCEAWSMDPSTAIWSPLPPAPI